MVQKTVPAKTANLARSTGSRLGTTVSEARIMPLLYSPVISRMPSTPMANCAKNVPVSEVEMAVVPGSNPAAALALIAANIAPRPIISENAVSKVNTVDRSERSLVHSEFSTRHWVTRRSFTGEFVPVAGAGVSVVVTPPPPLRARRNGIRRSRW